MNTYNPYNDRDGRFDPRLAGYRFPDAAPAAPRSLAKPAALLAGTIGIGAVLGWAVFSHTYSAPPTTIVLPGAASTPSQEPGVASPVIIQQPGTGTVAQVPADVPKTTVTVDPNPVPNPHPYHPLPNPYPNPDPYHPAPKPNPVPPIPVPPNPVPPSPVPPIPVPPSPVPPSPVPKPNPVPDPCAGLPKSECTPINV